MSKREDLGLTVICLVVILLSVGGIVEAVVSSLLPGLDGLLLVMICLMMIAIFSPPLVALAKEEGWLPSGGGKSAKGSGEGK